MAAEIKVSETKEDEKIDFAATLLYMLVETPDDF
jgi:hypothetical protein